MPLPEGKMAGICPRCLITALSEEEDESDSESLVAGYTVLEEISRGGMGVVYRARQQHPGRIVALKMILPQLLDSPNVRRRFEAEAEAVAKLDHPNVLPIYEAGEYRGAPFIAMKFVPGGSLADRRKEFLGMPRLCAQFLAEAARGVQHAHERGILHRDLKPANLLLDDSAPDAAPVPMVSDFGLARILESEPSGLTGPASFLGTAGYLAPELAFGPRTEPTVQSDIYSLGAILYELVAGQLPFGTEKGLEALRRADQETAPSLRALDSRIPKDFEAICLTCLQREPSSRYRSAAALIDDLERFLGGHPVLARPVPRLVRLSRWARRKPALAALSVAVILLVISALAGAALFTKRVARERDRATASEQEAQLQLWRAYLEQALATRIAPQMGRRFAAIEALAAAARIRPALELRNAAAAALGLEDIVLERRWPAMRSSIDTPVAFDEQLERYAFPQTGDRISLRRLRDNLELANFPAPSVTQLLFSKDGRFLAGRISETETWLWSVSADPSAQPQPVLKLTGAEKISEMAFTPDSRLFAVSSGSGELAFYDLTGAMPSRTAQWNGLPAVRGLRFDPVGQRLAITSAADAVIEIREVSTGLLLHKLSQPAGATGVDWSPDGTELATGSEDFQVRIWDAAKGALLRVLEGHQNVAVRPLYHPGGQILATAGWDAILRFWAPSTGRLLFNGPACHDWQRFSTDGSRLAVANYDGTVELYRVASTEAVRMFMPKTREFAPLLYRWLDFSPDSQRLVSTGAECVRVWDIASGVESAHVSLPGATAVTCMFADDRSVLIADESRGVTHQSIAASGSDGNLKTILEPWRTGEGWQATLRARDGRVILVNSKLGMAEIISPEYPAGRRIGPHLAMHNVALSPDGKRLATGTWQGTDIKIWEIATGQLLVTLPAGENALVLWPSANKIITVQLTQAGQWLENSDGQWKRDQVWKPDPGQTFWNLASLSPEGRWLALPQSGDRIRVLEMATGAELITLEPPKAFGLGFVRFSPDGRYLAACGSREQVAIWDLPELRRELAALRLDWSD
ncbi:MAG: eukaryotic-like serine/threonine-protein kinase [Verrucomicrobiota bacterium]|jgi:WD40 repeat protein